ncbi:MAG: DUF4252 domain-containing protein [Candidatus Krumholzibacteria bacterium]|jgi:hypothetical protein|nr:DUF4252 domain-containing protein [Candidatus Krumholzibacteria bacterium]
MNTLPTTRTAILVAAVAIALLLPAAEAAATKNPPGYIDLSWIEVPAGAAEVQELDLTTLLADVAASAQEQGDSELARLLSMVNTLQLKGYQVPGDDKNTPKAIERIEKMLADGGWNRIIYVKDGEETTSVSIYRHEGRIVGLTVVAYEPGDEVAFVNVTGKLDLGALLALAQRLGDSKDLGLQAVIDSVQTER